MKIGISNKNYQVLCAFLFLLPSMAVLIGFAYYPAFNAIYTSFTQWDGFFDPVFIGFDNYIKLFQDEIFYLSFRNVFYWGAGGTLAGMIAPFIAAELIYALKSKKLQYLYRSAFVLPMVVPALVTIKIWTFIYEPNIGMLNTLLSSIGLSGWTQNWLGNSSLVIPSLVFIGFPWVSGLSLLIYYAGLQGISADIIEYAHLDGCTGLKRVLKIDIPLILPQVKLILVLTIINTLQNITTPLLMTGGGPGYDSYVPGLYMYQKAFKQSEFGYSTAIATVMFAVILILTLLSMRIGKKSENQ